jgi:hypothetical protein
MARTPDLELHALWRERVHRQVHSGLTIAQFCTRERLAVSSFSNWKHRLRLIDLSGLASHRPALPAPSAFLPVTVHVLEHAHDESPPIEADLPNGIRLRIPTTNQRLASRLVRVVARARTNSGGSR